MECSRFMACVYAAKFVQTVFATNWRQHNDVSGHTMTFPMGLKTGMAWPLITPAMSTLIHETLLSLSAQLMRTNHHMTSWYIALATIVPYISIHVQSQAS